ncbi:MAG: hypothetical protein ACRDF4_06010, partial [Rhabdochlamydiaceae bacterium]
MNIETNMPNIRSTVNLRKFKDWVFTNLTPESSLYQVAQREKDELPLEEAIAKTDMICVLIDTS